MRRASTVSPRRFWPTSSASSASDALNTTGADPMNTANAVPEQRPCSPGAPAPGRASSGSALTLLTTSPPAPTRCGQHDHTAASALPRHASQERPAASIVDAHLRTKRTATMSTQISAITLGVSDIDRARRFYSEGLGCPVEKDHGTFVTLSLGAASSTLALYTRDALAADAGVTADGHGFHGFTLSYIADSAEEVDEMLAAAERAGGAITKPAENESWGGYGGYFTDPDGNLWKVASGA